jgi:hypothetical protein
MQHRIDEGDDIPAQTVTDSLDGIAQASTSSGSKVTRHWAFSRFGVTLEGPAAAFSIEPCWRMAHFVRGAGH